MGWDPTYKAISPRIGIAYQLNPKTVIRSGYGRSFDLGVFGSIFGHTATQNLPILTNQSIPQRPVNKSFAFALAAGRPPPITPVPASGLLPNPGFNVNSQGTSESAAAADDRCLEPEHPAVHHSDAFRNHGVRGQ